MKSCLEGLFECQRDELKVEMTGVRCIDRRKYNITPPMTACTQSGWECGMEDEEEDVLTAQDGEDNSEGLTEAVPFQARPNPPDKTPVQDPCPKPMSVAQARVLSSGLIQWSF